MSDLRHLRLVGNDEDSDQDVDAGPMVVTVPMMNVINWAKAWARKQAREDVRMDGSQRLVERNLFTAVDHLLKTEGKKLPRPKRKK